ncbi:hypothetical protein BN1088_290008 [Sphingobacterium sp. PM2-P1-29]|jgi:hypothetical protein|nr:hypothetical protein BN1088_290008 [Sphingobacterium sp. PM2-P1-29]
MDYGFTDIIIAIYTTNVLDFVRLKLVSVRNFGELRESRTIYFSIQLILIFLPLKTIFLLNEEAFPV